MYYINVRDKKGENMHIDKITVLVDGTQLFAYWANNKGRSKDNVTLVHVKAGVERPSRSRDISPSSILHQTRTGAWGSDVNMSSAVCLALGINKDIETLEIPDGTEDDFNWDESNPDCNNGDNWNRDWSNDAD